VDAGARRAKVAALVLLGLGVAFYLLFTVGEMASGDVSGIQHLPPVLVLAGLIWLAWRRPTTAGIVLLLLAVPLGVAYVVLLVVRDLPLVWALQLALPPVLAGLLLLRAGRPGRASRSAGRHPAGRHAG
jgi:peptidoglycan/LPS O-acetylase OafA/YrhL